MGWCRVRSNNMLNLRNNRNGILLIINARVENIQSNSVWKKTELNELSETQSDK